MTPSLRRLTLIPAILVALWPLKTAAQADSVPPTPSPAPVAVAAKSESKGALMAVPGMAIAALSTAGVLQAFGTPVGWPRTWSGYARRAGDQVGFLTIEETVRRSLGTTVNWVPDTAPCGGRASPHKWRNFGPRLGCAVRETMLLRTPEGRPRPNFPFVAGAVSASAISTTWRPDARTPSTKLSVAGTRTAFVLGGMVVSRLITDWRSDRR